MCGVFAFHGGGCVADNRVVKVTLRAQIAEYKKGMQEAAQATDAVADAGGRVASREQAFKSLAKVGATVATGFTLLAAVAVKKSAEFEQAMSNVAATGEDATQSFDALREAALEAGASTVFSATESANAIEEMAKAGVSAEDILSGGLTGALDLAAAGGLGVAQAAETAATALQMFGLKGTDMAHVADLLAAGAGKAMGDVSDLSAALAQGGLVAAATGLSIEETTAALAAFASQGLLGSDAGTSLKAMLQRLTPQSAEAAAKFEELGISAYDANGEFVGLEKFAGQLETAMKDLSPEARNAAMSVMFGSDAVRAANILYKEGAEGIKGWITAVDDQGYAAETAAKRLDNLKGDWEAFTGALDTAFITIGDGANGPLRDFVQMLTDLVDGFNDLPDWAQQLIIVTGAVAGLAGGAAFAIPKLLAFKDSVIDTFTALGKMSWIGGGVTLALGAVLTAVVSLAGEHAAAERKADSYAATLEAGTRRITDATRDMIAENLSAKDSFLWVEHDSVLESAEKLGISLELVQKAAEGNAAAIRELDKQLQPYLNSNNELENSAARVAVGVKGEADSLERAAEKAELKEKATKNLTGANEDAAVEAMTAGEAYVAEAKAVEDLERELSTLIETFNKANGVNQDAISQNIKYQDTLREAQEHIDNIRNGVDGFAASTDLSTEAGSRNMEMLVELAQNSWSAAEAQRQADGDTAAFNQRLIEGRQALIDTAIEMGWTAEEATALADSIFAIPDQHETEILADTAAAKNQVIDFADTVRDVPGSRVTTMSALTDVARQGVRSLIDEIAQVKSKTVTITANRALNFIGSLGEPNFQGGMYSNGVQEFAQGGFPSGIYDGVNGGIHKFAEREKGVDWEAYISGRAADRDRNIGIAFESLRRMGVNGGGGSTTTVSAPITVQAVPGMSEEQVGLAAAERLNYALRG